MSAFAIFSIATSTYNYIYASIVLMKMQSINNLKDTIIIKMAIGSEQRNGNRLDVKIKKADAMWLKTTMNQPIIFNCGG